MCSMHTDHVGWRMHSREAILGEEALGFVLALGEVFGAHLWARKQGLPLAPCDDVVGRTLGLLSASFMLA